MRKIALFVFALLLCGSGYASENWSGGIEKVTVFEDGSAYVIISSPYNGPVGTFGCTQNVVYLGVKNTPANSALLSQAMTVYATGKTIRFGVRGSGDACEAFYITAE